MTPCLINASYSLECKLRIIVSQVTVYITLDSYNLDLVRPSKVVTMLSSCYLTSESTINVTVKQFLVVSDSRVYNRKEGEYPTSLWYCVTTLYRVHDLSNDIHKESGFTVCPSTSHTSCSYCSGVVYIMPYRLASMPTNNKL